jgi:hypothetical protein
MAEDFANYLVRIESLHKDYLSHIRHWDNLKMATDADAVWVKNFTAWQLESKELLAIPFIKIYLCKDNLLFPKGSLLPLKKIPNLLWVPIERALNIELSNYNYNFFGINQSVAIRLVRTEEEKKATALVADVDEANSYLLNASSVRLKPLEWLLVNSNKALIFGVPMLPINGRAFWQRGNFLFPLGYCLEFPLMESVIERKAITSENQLIWWTTESSYCLIDKNKIQPLSIASWKQTIKMN